MPCLVFDFDGTLANTLPVILITLKNTLSQMNCSAPAENSLMPLIGLPLKEIFARASGDSDNSFLEACVRKYRQDFNGNCEGRLSLFPGVRETLEALVQRGDLLGIASSRGRESLLYLIRRLGLEKYFQAIAGEEDVACPKPAGDIVLHVLRKLAQPLSAALMVGDTIYDIGAGRACGVRTCAAAYGNQREKELLAAHPDFIITSFPEILSIQV